MISKDIIFETVINYNDQTGQWASLWNFPLKDHLNNNFCSIGFSEEKSSLKNLSDLQLTMKNAQKEKEALFTIYVVKVGEKGEVTKEIKEEMKINYKPTFLLVVLLPITELTDQGVKNALKVLDKVKKELDVQDLSWVPITKEISGPIYKTIEEFFKVFKQKVTAEFNSKLIYFNLALEKTNKEKASYTEIDKVYSYLEHKVSFMNYLHLSTNWSELQLLCTDDLYIDFQPITNHFSFSENCSYKDLNEGLIKEKINNKSLSNLDLHVFYIFYYMKCCVALNQFQNFNDFFQLLTKKINNFSIHFDSLYCFNFWSYEFINQIIDYIKTIKNNYTNYDTKIYSKALIILLYYRKKVIRSHAKAVLINFPNNKLYQIALNNDYKNITSELNKQLGNVNKEIEQNEQYVAFKSLIKKYEENTQNIFVNQKRLIEEYLSILTSIDECHIYLTQYNISNKTNIEKLPVLFALSHFDQMKSILISQKDKIKQTHWNYIHEYLTFVLVIIINFLEKTEENLYQLLKCLNVKLTQISSLNKLVNSIDENLITTIISKYISSFHSLKNCTIESSFNMSSIINIVFDYDSDKIIPINLLKEKEKEINIKLYNQTGYSFSLAKIILIFKEIFTNEIVEYISDNFLTNINSYTNYTKEKLIIQSAKAFKPNQQYILSEMDFATSNNIKGIYLINEKDSFIVNSKEIDLKLVSIVKNNYSIEEKDNLSTKSDHMFYYNILSLLRIDIQNMPDDEYMRNKSFHIKLDLMNKEITKASTKIMKEFLLDKNSIAVDNMQLKYEGKMGYNLNQICIPFLIEDIDYYTPSKNTLIVHTWIEDENKTYLYSHKQTHQIEINHLFSLSQKFKLLNNNNILLQASVMMNLELANIMVPIGSKIIEMDINQTINKVITLTNDLSKLQSILAHNCFKFSIGEQKDYRLLYPEDDIKEDLKEIIEKPFFIQIGGNVNLQIKSKLFEEYSLTVLIKKYIEEEVLLMLKMKENDNWSIIGKSKIIENLKKGKREDTITFKLFPLQDGYIKVPEITFMEYTMNKMSNNDINNIYSLEFKPIRYGSIIDGNEKIVKIESLNSCSLRLNLT